jgi:hypothetical protein
MPQPRPAPMGWVWRALTGIGCVAPQPRWFGAGEAATDGLVQSREAALVGVLDFFGSLYIYERVLGPGLDIHNSRSCIVSDGALLVTFFEFVMNQEVCCSALSSIVRVFTNLSLPPHDS